MGEAKKKKQAAVEPPVPANVQEAISAVRAREVLAAEQQKQMRECLSEINAALVKHGCILQAIVSIVGNQVQSDVRIALAPEKG